MKYVNPANATPSMGTGDIIYWDEVLGEKGSIPPAKLFTDVQKEIQNAIIGGGLVPDPQNNSQLFQAIQALISSIVATPQTVQVPIGSVSAYAGATEPAGWFFCRGQAVSRTTYSALFAAIGTAWGAGDGSTTFNLPDFRGEFLRGLDAGRGVDAARVLGSGQADEFKSHSHNYQQIEIIGNGERDNNAQAGVSFYPATTTAVGGSETRPRNMAVNYIIRA